MLNRLPCSFFFYFAAFGPLQIHVINIAEITIFQYWGWFIFCNPKLVRKVWKFFLPSMHNKPENNVYFEKQRKNVICSTVLVILSWFITYVSESTYGRYIVFHVICVCLSNTHVLYAIRLGFGRRLLIYACMSICSITIRSYTFMKNKPIRTLHQLKKLASCCFLFFNRSNFKKSYGRNLKFWKEYFFFLQFYLFNTVLHVIRLN